MLVNIVGENKAGKGKSGAAILDKVVMEVFTEKRTVEQRLLEVRESALWIAWKLVPGRKNSQCRLGHEAITCWSIRGTAKRPMA